MIRLYLQQSLHVQIAVHPSDTTLFVRNADITEENLQSKKRLLHNRNPKMFLKNPVDAGFFYPINAHDDK